MIVLQFGLHHVDNTRWELHNPRSSTLPKIYLYDHLPPISQAIKAQKKTQMTFYTWTSKNLHSSRLCGHWVSSQGLDKSNG